MLKAAGPRDGPTSAPLSGPPEIRARPVAVRPLRFDRTLGFWLGGFVLGAAGCLMGACVPYHRPVAVTASALWWGLYFGCLGANLGAWIGLLAERISASQSRESVGESEPPGGEARPALPAESNGTCNGEKSRLSGIAGVDCSSTARWPPESRSPLRPEINQIPDPALPGGALPVVSLKPSVDMDE
jgi:hypothetical protein